MYIKLFITCVLHQQLFGTQETLQNWCLVPSTNTNLIVDSIPEHDRQVSAAMPRERIDDCIGTVHPLSTAQ